MASLTLRNIPDPVMARIRDLAAADRRSLNNEILVLIERGLEAESGLPEGSPPLDPETQVKVWRGLRGLWKDNRSAAEIAEDIRAHRTLGRKVDL